VDTVRYFKTSAKAQLKEHGDSGANFGLQQMQHRVATQAGYISWTALLSADEADRQIAVVMDREPQLNRNGFGAGNYAKTPQERREQFAQWRSQLRSSGTRVAEIGEWLKRNVEPRSSINSRAGSYGLKHLAEKDLGSYVANGELIAAAIIGNYRYRRNGNTPNAVFSMTTPSIDAVHRRLYR